MKTVATARAECAEKLKMIAAEARLQRLECAERVKAQTAAKRKAAKDECAKWIAEIKAANRKATLLKKKATKKKAAKKKATTRPKRETLEDFAQRVNETARQLWQAESTGAPLVFIHRVWEVMRDRTIDRFKAKLLKASKQGLVVLAKADMPQTLNPADLDRSRIPGRSVDYVFVRVPEAQAPSPSAFTERLAEAFGQLDRHRNLVSLYELRAAMPEYPRIEFDRQVAAVIDAGTYTPKTSKAKLPAKIRRAGIKRGRSTYVFLSRDVGPEISSTDERHIRNAYQALREENGLRNVYISDLWSRSGTSLHTLHAFLNREREAHRANVTLGEPTAATQEQLAAALMIEGMPHVYVELYQPAEPGL